MYWLCFVRRDVPGCGNFSVQVVFLCVDQRDTTPGKSLDVWVIPSSDATGKIIALSVLLRKSIAAMNKVQGRIACRNAYW
jgi:hypothetical protein